MKKMLVFFAFLFMVSACQKEDPPMPPIEEEEEESQLDIVWQTYLAPDSNDYASFAPLVYQDNVLFSLMWYQENEILMMKDGSTGSSIWEWEGHTGSIPSKLFSEDELVVCSHTELYGLNSDNAGVNWSHEAPNDGGPRISQTADYIYHRNQSGGVNALTVELVRRSKSEGTWETIFTLDGDGLDDVYSIEPPASYTNPTGEKLIVFTYSLFDQGDNDNRFGSVVVMNETSKEVVFTVDQFDIDSHHIFPPLIHEDKAYIQGFQNVICLDLMDQTVLWTKSFVGSAQNLYTSNLLIEENILIVNPADRTCYGLNPATGQEIWVDTDAGSGASKMHYHNGLVYYVSEGRALLYAIEIGTGKHIWAEPTPNADDNPSTQFLSGLAINPDLGYLYTSDLVYAMCIKLPE